jgi:hypothetical protein
LTPANRGVIVGQGNVPATDMDGVFFLLSVIAIGLIMHWVVQNDKAGPSEPTRGLLAMDDEPAGTDQFNGTTGLPPRTENRAVRQ